MFKEINLELNKPTIEEALKKLNKELKSATKGDCLLLIHGYGSTGKGGDIKASTLDLLYDLLKQKKISKIFTGADFSMTTGKGYNYEAIQLRSKYAELNKYAFQRNRGITVVVI